MRLIFVSEANNSPLFVLLLVGWFRSSGQPTQHETVLKDDQVSIIIVVIRERRLSSFNRLFVCFFWWFCFQRRLDSGTL